MTRCGYGGGRLEHEHQVGDRGVEHGHANGVAVELTLELWEDLVRVRAAAAAATTTAAAAAAAAATATTTAAAAAAAAATATTTAAATAATTTTTPRAGGRPLPQPWPSRSRWGRD